jgi:hypothetical protein
MEKPSLYFFSRLFIFLIDLHVTHLSTLTHVPPFTGLMYHKWYLARFGATRKEKNNKKNTFEEKILGVVGYLACGGSSHLQYFLLYFYFFKILN